MFNRKKTEYDYDFKAITPVDFQLKLTFKADHKLLKAIWGKSAAHMKRKHGASFTNSPKDIPEFKADPKFYNYLKTATNGAVKNVAKIFKEDGIIIMDYKVFDAVYKMDKKENWNIDIYYKGVYHDARKN